MPLVLFGVVFDFLRRLGGDVVGDQAQWFAGLKRQHVGLTGPLEIEHPVEGFGDCLANHHNPVIAHHHHLFARIIEQLGTARALFFKRQPTIGVVHHHPVKEHRPVLIHGRQSAVGQRGQRGGIGRMHMHRTAGMRTVPVHPAMQTPGGRVRRVGPFHAGRIIGVDHDQIGCLDPGKVHLVGVHQELRAVVIDGERKVVGHRLVHVQPHGPAERGREVHTLLPVVDIGTNLCDGHGALHSVWLSLPAETPSDQLQMLVRQRPKPGRHAVPRATGI